jgi:Tol biopolymer transport system component
MNTRPRKLLAGVLVTLATTSCIAMAPPPSGASSASARNGRIAYSIGDQFPGSDDLGAHTDVFTIRPDGTDVRQLTHVPADKVAALPSWSADGTTIAYESNVSGDFEIWLMHADGTDQRQVTHDPGFAHLEPAWSPDGRRLAFERCDQPFGFLASCDLEIMNVDGTGMRRVVGGHRYHVHPQFSPDGRYLAFASDRRGFQAAIWVVKTDGTQLHRVTRPEMLAFWPSWTNEGRIVFTDNCCLPHSNVWTVRPDGTALRQVTHTPAEHNNGFASLSPDGRALVLDSDEAHADACCNDLVVQHPDGSRTTLVANANVVAADWGPVSDGVNASVLHGSFATVSVPTFAGSDEVADEPLAETVLAEPFTSGPRDAQRGRLAFADFNTGQIATLTADGTDLRDLTHTDAAHVAGFPDFSPDGKTVVYALIPQSSPFEARIWVVNADGTNAHQVANDAPGFRDYTPRYTPDGRNIVFSRCQPGDGVCAIWAMRADGTGMHAITPFRNADEAVDFGVSPSSDGKHVAFARFNWRGIAAQVFVVRLDGTREHAVTPAWLEASAPRYSPDGKYLVVTSQSPRLGSNIYSLRADGRDLQRLTATPYPMNDYDASFAPSGRRIAFATSRNYDDLCCADVFVMNANGTGEHQVSTGALQGAGQVAWGEAP